MVRMGNVVTINLDKMVSEILHGPKVDGIPLYRRVEGSTDDDRTKKTDKWIKASQKAYNSPNNVKNIFITAERVAYGLYQPVMGSTNKSLFRSKQYNNGYSLRDAYSYTLNNLRKRDLTALCYVVKGTGIGAIDKYWVCSNIEEIYFDVAILLSADIRNGGCEDLLVGYLQGKRGKIEAKRIYQIANICLGDKWEARFPRLKVIGFFDGLDKIVEKMTGLPGELRGIQNRKFWYEVDKVKEVIPKVCSTYGIYIVPREENKLISKYALRSGIYSYDDDVLSSYFKKLERQILEYRMSLRDARLKAEKEKAKALEQPQEQEVIEVEESTEESLLEQDLNSSYEAMNKSDFETYINVILTCLSKSQREEELKGFSKAGREKYGRYF